MKKTSVEKTKLEIVKETRLIAIEMIVAFKDVDQSVFVNSVIKIEKTNNTKNIATGYIIECIKHRPQAIISAERVNKIRERKNKSFRFKILQ